MSNHLIQPVEIEGTKYCPMYQGGRMTQGVETEIIVVGAVDYADVSTPGSPWTLITQPIGDIAAEDEVSFGVACGDVVTIDFTSYDTSTAPDYAVLISIYVDGVGPVITPFYLFNYAPDSTGVVINLADVACGSVITLVANAARADLVPEDTDGVLTVTAEVASIT